MNKILTDGKKERLLRAIKKHGNKLQAKFDKKANHFGKKYFEDYDNKVPTSPHFIMFKQPPYSSQESSFWSYRKILEKTASKSSNKKKCGLLSTIKDEDGKMEKHAGKMWQIIMNLTREPNGPMSVPHLNSISSTKPDWEPEIQTLEQLESIVNRMNGKPKPRQGVSDPNFNQTIVIWALFKNLSILVSDIAETAEGNISLTGNSLE